MATAQAISKEQVCRQNLFILFYTLRVLWKLNTPKDHKTRKVPDLYKLVFPTKSGGNKTLYDNILKLQDCKVQRHSKRLAELTGIEEQCFTGKYPIPISTLTRENWLQFIALRQGRGNSTKATQKQVEAQIKEAIGAANKNHEKEKLPFRRLVYFSKYGQNMTDKAIGTLFREIESKIAECEPKKFENADISLLESHQQAIREHLDHIGAVIIIKKWKKMD